MATFDVNENGGVEPSAVDRMTELAQREEEIMKSTRLAELRSNIDAMNPWVSSALKINYYKSKEALTELLRILENVDAELHKIHDDPTAGYGSYALISEVMVVSEAIAQLKRSYLGRVL